MATPSENSLSEQLFRRKPAATLRSDAETHAGGLKRALGALDLTLLGIGAIVGAGIFVMTGVGARQAGPGLRGRVCQALARWQGREGQRHGPA